MTQSLNFAAQTLLDLYYQDYAPAGAFIELAHVKSLMYSEYERMLQEEYRAAKILNRTLDGFSFVTLDGDILIPETVDVKKVGDDYVGTLTSQAYAFNFDSMGTGVQRVRNLDATCRTSELIRIPQSEAWVYCIAPPSNKTYFYVQNISAGVDCPITTQIVILGSCHPKQVEVQYLPALTEGGDIQIAARFVKRITDSVLQSLLIAKQQVVVDKTNDSNPNAAMATEANQDNVQPNP